RLGGLEVNCHLKFGRQLDRQVGRLGASEDAIDVGHGATKDVSLVGSIGKQPALSNSDNRWIDHRHIVSSCEQYDCFPMDEQKSVRGDDEPTSRLASKRV